MSDKERAYSPVGKLANDSEIEQIHGMDSGVEDDKVRGLEMPRAHDGGAEMGSKLRSTQVRPPEHVARSSTDELDESRCQKLGMCRSKSCQNLRGSRKKNADVPRAERRSLRTSKSRTDILRFGRMRRQNSKTKVLPEGLVIPPTEQPSSQVSLDSCPAALDSRRDSMASEGSHGSHLKSPSNSFVEIGGALQRRLSRSASVGTVPFLRRGELDIFNTPEEGMSTASEDIVHDIKSTFLLLPIVALMLPTMLITFIPYGGFPFLKVGVDRDFMAICLMVFHWALCLAMFFQPMIAFWKVVLAFVVQTGTSLGVFLFGTWLFPVFSALGMQLMVSIAFASGTALYSVLFFRLHGRLPMRTAWFYGILTIPTAFANTSVFIWYFTGSAFLEKESWWAELAVLGVGYPFFAAFSGRMMLADFFSFLVYANTSCDQLEVFHFFVRFAKMIFFLTAQIVLFRMTDHDGFVLANLTSIALESVGLYFHTKLITSKYVQVRSTDVPTNLMKRWMWENQRTGLKTKFACFYFNEAITEKVGCFAVIVVACGFQVLENLKEHNGDPFANTDRFQTILNRGILLISFELLEDFIKKQVLKSSLQLSLSHIRPALTIYDSILMGQFVAVTVSWLFIGQYLLDTYFDDMVP